MPLPGLHVYHYGAYERSRLSELIEQHGTREEEMDDLLRGAVLVDSPSRRPSEP